MWWGRGGFIPLKSLARSQNAHDFHSKRRIATSRVCYSLWETFLKKSGLGKEKVTEAFSPNQNTVPVSKAFVDHAKSAQLLDKAQMSEQFQSNIPTSPQTVIKPRPTPKHSRRKESTQNPTVGSSKSDAAIPTSTIELDLLSKTSLKSLTVIVNQKMKNWKRDLTSSVHFKGVISNKTITPKFLGLQDSRSLVMLEMINARKKSTFERTAIAQFTHHLETQYKELYPNGRISSTGSSGCGFDLLGDLCTLTSLQNQPDQITSKKSAKSLILAEIDHLKQLLKSSGFPFKQHSKNQQIFFISAPDYPNLNVVFYVGSLQRLMLAHWARLNMFLDSRVQLLLTFMKLWLKNYPTLSSYHQLFSDEAIMLLVMFFLNKTQILPNLVNEFPDECKVENILNFKTDRFPSYTIEHEDKNISDLFVEMLEFYSNINWNNYYIDIKSMQLQKLNSSTNKNTILGSIKEPFFGNYFFNAAANPKFASHLKSTFQNVANDLKTNSCDSDADIFYGSKYT